MCLYAAVQSLHDHLAVTNSVNCNLAQFAAGESLNFFLSRFRAPADRIMYPASGGQPTP